MCGIRRCQGHDGRSRANQNSAHGLRHEFDRNRHRFFLRLCAMYHGYGEEHALDLPVASTAAVVSGRGGRRTWTRGWERRRLERRRMWGRRVRRIGRRLRTDIDSVWVLQPPTGRNSVHLAGARPPLNASNVAYTHWKFVRAKFGDAIFKAALWLRRVVFQTPCLCWSRAAIGAVGT